MKDMLLITRVYIDRYGRLYCVQVDRVALQLNMYRFYRDAVVPQVDPVRTLCGS